MHIFVLSPVFKHHLFDINIHLLDCNLILFYLIAVYYGGTLLGLLKYWYNKQLKYIYFSNLCQKNWAVIHDFIINVITSSLIGSACSRPLPGQVSLDATCFNRSNTCHRRPTLMRPWWTFHWVSKPHSAGSRSSITCSLATPAAPAPVWTVQYGRPLKPAHTQVERLGLTEKLLYSR